MKKNLLALVLLVFTHGVSSAPPKDVFSDKQRIELTKHTLESSLKDPASVQYKNVGIIAKKAGTKTVCGEYNAKNSFGGYGGFKRFAAPTSNSFLLDTNVDMESWIKLCVTDENEAILNSVKARAAAKAEAEKEPIRQVRRENIERTCAEKRQTIEAAGGPDVETKKDELARSCAELITKSNAN